MAQFHFVEYYECYASGPITSHPRDEAMSLAVGGSYDEIGGIEAAILKAYNVNSSSSIVDLGCGSGRLAPRPWSIDRCFTEALNFRFFIGHRAVRQFIRGKPRPQVA